VVVLGRTVGSVATPSGICGGSYPYINGKTLTHEMGHFFGLRHIWGDEDCGNDYVDDTPVHFEDNLGVPKHPKPNDCGTEDEMFENFMDYSDDQVLNTFTAGQVARMQTVMLNSPRRVELATATTAKACFTGNKLSFSPCIARDTTVERSVSGTCPSVRTVQVMLAAEEAASGAATVNINVVGGTASLGLDFRLPQTTFTFAAGDPYKMISIEVIDDGVVENDESVILSYTITSGTGVTAGGVAQQFTLIIKDNDNLVINNRAVDIINTGFSTVPADWNVLSSDSAVNKWLIGPNATGFSGNAAYISNNAATAPWFYETENAPSASVLRTRLIDVMTSNYKRLTLSFRHRVFGEGLFQGDGPYDYGFVGLAPADVSDFFFQLPSTSLFYEQNSIQNFSYNFGDSLLVSNFYLGWVWQNDDSFGDQPPWGIDDVKLQGFQTQIATATGQTRTINLSAGQTNHFTSTDKGDILATIAGSSGQVNCVQASIAQSGAGQVNITTQSGTFKRSAKVIQVSPTGGSSNATYTITLYFTEEELAAWGAVRSSLRVMKVNDGVLLSSVLTNANSAILTPVVSDLIGASGYMAYTVTTTGFSQFFLVEPNTTLPLRLIDFTAKPRTNDIELRWATAGEQYNRGFELERSSDGIAYSTIASIAGKNTGSVPRDFTYNMIDGRVQKGVKYYYRLLQTDLDGRQTYSPVQAAMLQGSKSVSVYPNPGSDKVRIQLDKSQSGVVELFDAKGARVKTWGVLTIPNGGAVISVKGLPAGVYMLKVSAVSAGKEVYTTRLQKE
jgi:hypothetical protein